MHFDMFLAALLAQLIRLSLQQVSIPIRAFAEGDTDVDIYINGDLAPTDPTLDIYYLNTNYEIQGVNSGVEVFRLASDLVDGDVIAIRATNNKPTEGVEVDTGHTVLIYPSYGAWILALPNFVISTAEHWRCTSQFANSWFAQSYNDASWPMAVEYPIESDCCPWRDRNKAWAAVNAQWLWTDDPVTNRTVYCRYTVDTTDLAEGMDGSGQTASTLAPDYRIQAVRAGSSWITLDINITTVGARVYCLPINTLYRLRTPTSKEIEKSDYYINVTELTDETWVDADDSDVNSNIPSTTSAHIEFTTTTDIEGCRQECRDTLNCGRIAFWIEGTATPGEVDQANCQLLESSDNPPALVSALDPTSVIFHQIRVVTEKLQTIDIQDGLSAGTDYEVYCTVHGPDGSTTPLDDITTRMAEITTTGCFDCGIQTYPVASIRGGFVTASRIFMTIRLNLEGKAYCMARPYDPITGEAPEQPTEVEFRISALVVPTGSRLTNDISIDIREGVQPDTAYSFWCMTISASGSGISPDEAIDATRREVRTLAEDDAASLMLSLSTTEELRATVDTLKLVAGVSVTGPAMVWCIAIDSLTESASRRMPDRTAIRSGGVFSRILIPRIQVEVDLIDDDRFTIDSAGTYEIYCDAEEDPLPNNSTWTPYPALEMARIESNYASIDLFVNVDRAANISCVALPWILDASSGDGQDGLSQVRPESPSVETVQLEGVNAIVTLPLGGQTTLRLPSLRPGTLHDIYCSTADPVMGENALIYTIDDDAMWGRRQTVHTKGPTPLWKSVECSAGGPCTISGFTGFDLKPGDGLVVRSFGSACRVCECNGVLDPVIGTTGSLCMSVLKVDPQSTATSLALDPRGPWCYVDELHCGDAEESPYHAGLFVSYEACQDRSESVVGLEGFARTADGTNFTWYEEEVSGEEPKELVVTAPGGVYDLCWCPDDPSSSTETCTQMRDYSLYLGILYIRGVSVINDTGVYYCTAGRNCSITLTGISGIAEYDRLAAIPGSCSSWRPTSERDYPGAPGFPDSAITLPLYLSTTYPAQTFSWASPIFAQGGSYSLCWCTANEASDCQSRIIGVNFLGTVGSVRVIGPITGRTFTCKFGAPCNIRDVGGLGLRGDDRVIVSATTDCSVGDMDVHDEVLQAYGRTLDSLASDLLWYDAGNDFPEIHQVWYSRAGMAGVDAPLSADLITGPVVERISVPGFPGDGRSSATQLEGTYTWGEEEPVWPLVAGDYSLCWCGGGLPCIKQEHFNVHLGVLQVYGALSLPPTRLQMVSCIAFEKCVIRNLLGKLFISDRIAITSRGCGPAFRTVGDGVPNQGVSLPSANGRDFEFAEPPGSTVSDTANILTLPGGQYFLCLCSRPATSGSCVDPQYEVLDPTSTGSANFNSLAAVLLVRSPKVLSQAFFCFPNNPCTIGPVEGFGLAATDRMKVTASCATGEAKGITGFPNGAVGVATTEEGTYYSWGTEPVTAPAGLYHLCWSALSFTGTYHYIVDVGTLTIAGPQPHQVKNCYERLPCIITNLQGSGMENGDVLIALLGQEDGCEDLPSGSAQRAPIGIDGVSYPATNGGRDYAFSNTSDPSDTLLLFTRPPLFWKLCWVENGDISGGTIMQAGILNVSSFETWYRMNKSGWSWSNLDSPVLIGAAAALFPLLILFCACRSCSGRARRARARALAMAYAEPVVEKKPETEIKKSLIAEIRKLRRAAKLRVAKVRSARMMQAKNDCDPLGERSAKRHMTATQLAETEELPGVMRAVKAKPAKPSPPTIRQPTPQVVEDPFAVPPPTENRQRQHMIATAPFPIHQRIDPQDRLAWTISRFVNTDKLFPMGKARKFNSEEGARESVGHGRARLHGRNPNDSKHSRYNFPMSIDN